jgi:hypothetical protein
MVGNASTILQAYTRAILDKLTRSEQEVAGFLDEQLLVAYAFFVWD